MSNEYRNFKMDGEELLHEIQGYDNAADQLDAIRSALVAAYQLGRKDEFVGYDPDTGEVAMWSKSEKVNT